MSEKTSNSLNQYGTKKYNNPLVNHSLDAIIATDKDLNIIVWNKAAESMYGWKLEEVLQKGLSVKIRNEVLDALAKAEVMKSITEEGSWTGEASSYKKDGSKLNTWIYASVLWDSGGNFNGIFTLHCNAATRKDNKGTLSQATGEENPAKDHGQSMEAERQTESARQSSKMEAAELAGRNQDLADNIKLGVFRCTPGTKGKFLEVNKAMEEITGYSKEELLQLRVCDLYDEKTVQELFTEDMTLDKGSIKRELAFKRKTGDKIIVAADVMTIRFDSGKVMYFDGILEDITERRKEQQQLQQSVEKLQAIIRQIIQAIAYVGEARDPYTAGHQRRVAQLSAKLSKMLSLREDQSEGLTMAAFVHDIGKILVPADILSKPGKLTKPEFDIIKSHSQLGYEILKTIDFPWPIGQIVLQHHERINGSGYPTGLLGDKIIIEAKILAVADVVEAMSSHRPYRPTLGIDSALEEITRNKGVLYDPNIVEACFALFKNEGFIFN